MPLVRKIMNLRTSRAVCLPKSWLDFFENENQVAITEVAMEVDRVLTITVIIPKKKATMETESAQPPMQGVHAK